jgi:RNA polymerase sigma-70 factor (sigma-E family)
MGSRPGDADFEEFVRASWRRLGQAAYALTGDTQEAEDLVQSVLERTYARWSKVGGDDPTAYVRRALVHAYVDGWRRRRRLRLDAVEAPPEVSAADAIGFVDERVDLRRLLAELTERERAMVVLRYYLDCSEREVAAVLGCSVGTVKSTCSRALARLRVPSESNGGTPS